MSPKDPQELFPYLCLKQIGFFSLNFVVCSVEVWWLFFPLSQRVFSQWPAVYYSYEVHGRPDTNAKPQGKWYVCLCLSTLWEMELIVCVDVNKGQYYWHKTGTSGPVEPTALLPACTYCTASWSPMIPWIPGCYQIVIWLLSSFATVWPPPSSFLLTSHI